MPPSVDADDSSSGHHSRADDIIVTGFDDHEDRFDNSLEKDGERANGTTPSNDIHIRRLDNGHQPPQPAQRGDDSSTLIFRDVCVSISNRDILRNVSGIAKCGQILAIMGPAGAGKTTLLNLLAGRLDATSGDVTLNGQNVTRQLRRKMSYVQQTDIFFPELTLKETLTFAALLRLPDSMPRRLKLQRITEVVDILDLNKCFKTKIGGKLVTGLSGGERKRASIACELLTNPRVLILDEPTSGLDSAISLSLMSSLTRYARDRKKTVVTTIHQPSSAIFHMFGNVLLMTEGEVAYFGPGKRIMGFFANLGLHCAPLYNPADFILEQLKLQTKDRVIQGAYALRESDDWPEELRRNPGSSVVETETETIRHGVSAQVNDSRCRLIAQPSAYANAAYADDKGCSVVAYKNLDSITGSGVLRKETDVESYVDPESTWQTGFLTQYRVLTRRAFLAHKSKHLSPTLFFQILFMSTFAGLVWFQSRREEETARDRLGILVFITMQFTFFPMMHAIYAVVDEEGVFNRERSSGIYRLSAHYLAITTTEIPTLFSLCTMYCCIIYWMTGLMASPGNFFCFWLLMLLQAFTAQGIGMFGGVLITDRSLAIICLQSFAIATNVAGGFYNTHVKPWFKWAKFLSCVMYTLSTFGHIEFSYGSPLKCRPANATQFPNPCANSTWLPGEIYLESVDLNLLPTYVNIIVTLSVLFVTRIGAYVTLRFFRRPKL